MTARAGVREGDKDRIGPDGVGEMPQPSSASASSAAKQPVVPHGLWPGEHEPPGGFPSPGSSQLDQTD